MLNIVDFSRMQTIALVNHCSLLNFDCAKRDYNGISIEDDVQPFLDPLVMEIRKIGIDLNPSYPKGYSEGRFSVILHNVGSLYEMNADMYTKVISKLEDIEKSAKTDFKSAYDSEESEEVSTTESTEVKETESEATETDDEETESAEIPIEAEDQDSEVVTDKKVALALSEETLTPIINKLLSSGAAFIEDLATHFKSAKRDEIVAIVKKIVKKNEKLKFYESDGLITL